MVYPLTEDSRDSDESHPRSHFHDESTAHHSHCDAFLDNLRLHWFSEGVSLGRQLQRDDDEERLSRYKVRMRAQALKYQEEVLLRKRFCQEMQLLQKELLALKDELLVAQAAYEELVTASGSSSDIEDDFDALQQMQFIEQEFDCDQLTDDDTNQSRSETCKPGQDLSDVATLLSAAHEGDSVALQHVQTLMREAERTPKRQRSPAQTHLLVCWKGARNLSTADLPLSEVPEIFVDASTYGIGFIFNNRWLAWKFKTSHPLLPLGPDGKLIMSWAELVAAEMGIRTLIAASFKNITINIHSDNEGVVMALTSGKWTRKYGLDEIVKRIGGLCRRAGLCLKTKWISTKENPADDPSRGVYPPAELGFHHRPPIPRNLFELIQEVE